MGNIFRWARSRWKRLLSLCVLTLFVGLNLVAYLHARAMTCFVTQGSRTAAPEKLTRLQKAKLLLTGVTIPRPENHGTPDRLGLTFETIVFPSDAGIELEAWHMPNPKGQAIVLMFHGYAGCKADLLQEARAFYDLGYVPFLVDFRGSGGSSGNETSIGVNESHDVVAAVNHVRARWPGQPLILYGCSMGSVAILRAFAMHDLQASAAILESPFDRLTSTVANRFDSMGVPATPGVQLLVFWGGVQKGFNGFQHNPVEYAQAVEVPTLVLHGSADVRATKSQVQAVFKNLPDPKQIECFEGVGHEPCLAADRAKWHQVVAAILSTHVRPAGGKP